MLVPHAEGRLFKVYSGLQALAKPALLSSRVKLAVAKDGYELASFSVNICKVDKKQQIITGEVYAPFIIDAHTDMMEPEDVKVMAHRFMLNGLNHAIDFMHNNEPIAASAVESFIATNHPDYNDGAWVLSTKIFDPDVWELVEKGEIAAYSFEALVRKQKAVVEIETVPDFFGITEPADDGHSHVFKVSVDEVGRVSGGITAEVDGHLHKIIFGSATEATEDHAHRFFLG